MLEETVIDSQYQSFVALLDFLAASGEITHAEVVGDALRRNFVIAAASFYEQIIKQAIADFPVHRGSGHPAIVSLVRKGLVDRGYHTMFDWDSSNANKFFSHFGEEFASEMKTDCKSDEHLRDAARVFLGLGALRNTLVHSNFAVVSFETSLEEAYGLFTKAKVFVRFIASKLGPIAADEARIEPAPRNTLA